MTAHLLSVLHRGAYTSALVRILGQVPDSVRERTVVNQRAYLDYWRHLLQDAVAAGQIRNDLDISVVLMMLTGALNWAVEWHRPDGSLNPEELAIQFVSLVYDGIAADPSTA